MGDGERTLRSCRQIMKWRSTVLAVLGHVCNLTCYFSLRNTEYRHSICSVKQAGYCYGVKCSVVKARAALPKSSSSLAVLGERINTNTAQSEKNRHYGSATRQHFGKHTSVL